MSVRPKMTMICTDAGNIAVAGWLTEEQMERQAARLCLGEVWDYVWFEDGDVLSSNFTRIEYSPSNT